MAASRARSRPDRCEPLALAWSRRPPCRGRVRRAIAAVPSASMASAAVRLGCFFFAASTLRCCTSGSLRPSRIGGDRGLALRRRQIAARRHHQRRALAIIDALAVPLQAEVLEELPHELGVERHVLVLVRSARRRCRRSSHRRQRHGQRDGRRGSAAPLPVRISVPHGYPLQLTAEMCAVSPRLLWRRDQGAFAASPPSRVSYKRPITPATMATSARLKTYHLKLKLAVVR